MGAGSVVLQGGSYAQGAGGDALGGKRHAEGEAIEEEIGRVGVFDGAEVAVRICDTVWEAADGVDYVVRLQTWEEGRVRLDREKEWEGGLPMRVLTA